MFKLLIWGTGKRADNLMNCNCFEGNCIEGFIDSKCKVEKFHNYPVLKPEAAYTLVPDIDYIIIATMHYTEIYEKLIENNIPRSKVIFTDCVYEAPYINDDNIVKMISEKLYERMAIQSARCMIGMNERDKTDEERIIGTAGFNEPAYMLDYFRYRTFEFLANEIIENNVEGKIAEVGVFRGTFAKLINQKFWDREFYLFDSFEGFREEEVEKEIQLGRCDRIFKDNYTQTTEELVLEKMLYPEKCRIFKGLFPDTVTEDVNQSKFAFVSLDVDLEESTYQGIQFFYPRIVGGGILYIHDYNSSHLFGVKKAVMRYEKDNNIVLKKVPLADQCGTLVIIK